MIEVGDFVRRHGEPAAQALIENIERFSGVRVRFGLPLEQRWHDVIGDRPAQQSAKAG